MAFLSTAVSFSRYRVTEALPADFWNWAIERIQAEAFKERPGIAEERSVGWVSALHPFREELSLPDISYGQFVVLALRIDERRVPQAVLKKHCLMEEKIQAETGYKRLPKKVRSEIQERVRLQLLTKVLAVPKTFDMCMNTASGKVLFFSCQEKVQVIFEDLFYRTFGQRLNPVIPYVLASDLLKDEQGRKALGELHAEVLV